MLQAGTVGNLWLLPYRTCGSSSIGDSVAPQGLWRRLQGSVRVVPHPRRCSARQLRLRAPLYTINPVKGRIFYAITHLIGCLLAWRSPTALESSLVYAYELWVFATCPALRGSTVSYAGVAHVSRNCLEYSMNLWSRSKKNLRTPTWWCNSLELIKQKMHVTEV